MNRGPEGTLHCPREPNAVVTGVQGISLGDIRFMPMRWVLALFLVSLNFWSNAQNFVPLRGVSVDFLKSARKGRFGNVCIRGGGGHIFEHRAGNWTTHRMEQRSGGDLVKFYCLRQVHLAENLPQATHTQNRVKNT